MSKAVVRSGFDTWVGSVRPSMTHASDKVLHLDSGDDVAYIYFKIPAPKKATITKATLRLYAYKASSGNRTLTFQRAASSWSASKLVFTKRPSGTGTAVTKAIGSLKAGEAVDIDVTSLVQSITNGAANYGFRIQTSSTTEHYFYGLNSTKKPTLTVEWSDAPAKPTRLAPAGVVGITKPILTFDYLDVSGNTSLAAVQVQIDSAADEVSPDFDSGEVATTAPELDLTATAFPGLTNGVETQWRVRAKDGSGLWSEWSAWETLSLATKMTAAIVSPSGGFVSETTPPIVWTSSAAQSAFQVIITQDTDVLHDSGKRLGDDQSYTIPKKVITDGSTYTVTVHVWDTVEDRVETPGDPVYTEVTTSFVVQDDASTTAVSGLRATMVAGDPWITLSFSRPTAPDSFTILRDGKVLDDLIDPAEFVITGTTYRWTDYSAAPNRDHVYEVKAVVNGKQSKSATTTAAPTASGLRLADPEAGRFVALWGDDEGTWETEDDAAVYTPVGSPYPVRIVSGLRALSGSLTGLLMEGFGKTFAQLEADLYAIKEQPSSEIRLVAGDVNLPVLIGNLRISPTPTTRRGRLVKNVAFDFWQVGELPHGNVT